MPYLVLTDAESFIEFIRNVFSAEEKLRVDRPDGSLMHGEYSINGGTVMVGQAGGEWQPFIPCSMFVVTKNVHGIYDHALNSGANGNQEPADRGYGLSAGFIDGWGNQWWLNDPESHSA